MTKILNDLGFIVKSKRNFLNLKVPSWRPDITQEIDVIEELMRIYGYDKIKLIDPIKDRKTPTLKNLKNYFIFCRDQLRPKDI